MSSLQLRPRFRKTVDLEAQQIKDRVNRHIKRPDKQIDATVIDNHVILRLLSDEQHYWSPQLSLQLHENDQGTLIRGLYGPDPKVWTLFIFLYTGVGFIGLIGLMYGLAQWSLGMSPVVLWIGLAAGIMEFVIYLVASAGKRIASEQMALLQQEFDKILLQK